MRYWPEPERVLLQYYGLAYAPDLVTVAFVPNDVIGTFIGVRGIEVSEGYLVTRRTGTLGSAGPWLYVHSELVRALLVPYVTAELKREQAREDAPDWGNVYRSGGRHEKDWLAIEAEYEKVIDLATRSGARIAFIHILQRDPWPRYARYVPDRLGKWCAAKGVLFIDTLAVLEARSQSEVLYWRGDGHPNPAGYKVIAETIVARLTTAGLVP